MLYPAELRSRRWVLCLQNGPFASAVGGAAGCAMVFAGRAMPGGRLRQTGYAQCSRRSFVLAGLAAVCSQRGDLTEGRGCPGSSMMIR